MLDVKLLAAGRDVASAERLVARVADEVEAPKVVALAQRVLPAILRLDREELGGDDDVAILRGAASMTIRTVSDQAK